MEKKGIGLAIWNCTACFKEINVKTNAKLGRSFALPNRKAVASGGS